MLQKAAKSGRQPTSFLKFFVSLIFDKFYFVVS